MTHADRIDGSIGGETSFTVRPTVYSGAVSALVVRHESAGARDAVCLDGLTSEMLRGLSRFFARAAEEAKEYEDALKGSHGPRSATSSYGIEWTTETFPWISDTPLED